MADLRRGLGVDEIVAHLTRIGGLVPQPVA
jgi:hypothetical protein